MAYMSELQAEFVDYKICKAFGAVHGLKWPESGQGSRR